MARVVVVGGGFAGLATAARLARGRHQVTVLDRARELGGSLRPYVVDGIAVPPPPTSFTMPAVLRDLFVKTGRPIERELELVPVDPARRYVFADGTELDLPSGSRADTIVAFDAALGRGAGAEWEALLVRGRKMWEILRPGVIEQPIDGRVDLMRRLSPARTARVLQPWRTLRSLGRSALSDPRARQVLDSYSLAAGAQPRRAPAALATLPYLEHAFGVWRVDGGSARLIAALVERATLRGAELRTGCEVVEIVLTDDRVAGVRLADGEHVRADVVVSAIDSRSANGLVHTGARPWRSVPVGREGPSRLTVVLTSTEPAPRLPMEMVFLGEGDAGVGLGALTPTPARTPSLGPTIRVEHRQVDGTLVWTVSADAAPHGLGGVGQRSVDWRSEDLGRDQGRALLDGLARRGLDLRSATIGLVDTPALLEDRTGAPGGAVHGPAPHGVLGAFARATNRSRIPGLYAVGASAHPGPGLPFTGLSAVLVSDLLGVVPRAGATARSAAGHDEAD